MKRLLLTLLLLVLPAAAQARVVVSAHVRYATQAGQSQYQETDVTLMSWQELNEATHTFNYSFGQYYAVVFFAQGEAAVIQLQSLFCGAQEFEARCIPSFGNMRGRDQGGREWEICTSSFCA